MERDGGEGPGPRGSAGGGLEALIGALLAPPREPLTVGPEHGVAPGPGGEERREAVVFADGTPLFAGPLVDDVLRAPELAGWLAALALARPEAGEWAAGLRVAEAWPLARERRGFAGPGIAETADSGAEAAALAGAFARHCEEEVFPALAAGGAPAPEPGGEALLALGGGPGAALARGAFVSGLASLCARRPAFPAARFVCLLLGRRTTQASVDLVPPFCAADLVRAALRPRTARGGPAQTDLARAVTKHCLRSSAGRWGAQRGGAAELNARALALLLSLLRGAVWLNWHLLPHGLCAYELRDAEGYGARWIFSPGSVGGPGDGPGGGPGGGSGAAALAFRGLLEPPMPDGHERGWRH